MESIAARANRTALNVIMEDCFIAFDLLAKYTNLLDSAGMAVSFLFKKLLLKELNVLFSSQKVSYLVDRYPEVEALGAAYGCKVYSHQVSVGVHHRASA